MSIRERADQPVKRIDLYLGVLISILALCGIFASSITAWNTLNFRVTAIEVKQAAYEKSDADQSKQLRVLSRNIIKLGVKLGIDMENPE